MPIDNIHEDTDKTIIDYLIEAGYSHILDFSDLRYEEYEDDVTEEQLFPDYEDEDEDEDDDTDGPVRPWWSGGSEAYFFTADDTRRELQEEYDEYKHDPILKAQEIFGCEEMEREEFLMQTPWDLMKITAHQFHMIDPDCFTDLTLPKFIRAMSDASVRSAIPAIEDRIAYATLYANTQSDEIISFYGKDMIQYLMHIAKSKPINQAIQLVQMYSDYLSMRDAAMDYIDEYIYGQENPEHPVYDYVLYPKLNMIKDLHDKAMRDSNAYRELQSAYEVQKVNDGIELTTSSPDYLKHLYSDNNYVIIAPKNWDDLKREGEELNNCVGTYGRRLAEGDSLIYFIRRKGHEAESFYTAEIIIEGRASILTQLYTYDNDTYKTDDFTEFVKRWCKLKKIYIRCEM